MTEIFEERVSTVRVRAARGTVTDVRRLAMGRAVTTRSGGPPDIDYRSVWRPPPSPEQVTESCRHWLEALGRQHPHLVLRLLYRTRAIMVAEDDGHPRHDRTTHISIMIDGRTASSPVRGRSWIVRELAELTVDDLENALGDRADSTPFRPDPWPDASVRLPVVFAPGVGGTALHEVVGHGLEADPGREIPAPGTRFGGGRITVVDDPTRPDLWGSRRIDDEGVAAAPVTLVRAGVVQDALHVRATSPHASSARRADYRSRPLARMSNTYLAPGDDDPAALLAGRAVVYCTEGGSAEVRPGSRDIVLRIRRAQVWRDGAPASTHRDLVLHFTADDLLHGIDGAGPDLAFRPGRCIRESQAVPVSHGAPTFRLARVRVTGG